MKNKMFLSTAVFFILLLTVSCASSDVENSNLLQKCSEGEMKEKYFTDWKGSLECAYDLSRNSRNEKTVQTARHILGEYYFLSGDHDKAFYYFKASVSGPEGVLSLASLNYIRKLYIPFEKFDELAGIQTDSIKDMFSRNIIRNEFREWAQIIGNIDKYNNISLSMNILSHVSISVSGSENTVSFSLSTPSDTLNIFNHVPEKKGKYSIAYDFSINQDAVLPLMFQTGMKTDIYIDGTALKADERSKKTKAFSVVRNGGTFKFTKGDHKIVFTADIDEGVDPRIKVFLPDEKNRISYLKTGIEGKSLRFEAPEPEPECAFDEFIIINGADASGLNIDNIHFTEFFSKVLGSINPSVLYTGSEIFFRNNENEKGFALLKKAVTAYPGLVRPAIALADRTGGKHEGIPDGIDKSFLIADILSSKGQTAAGLKHSFETFRKYRSIYAAWIYYALSLEEYGDLREAVKMRTELLKKFPNHFALMESILVLSEKTSDITLRKEMLKRMLSIDPDNIKLKKSFAGVFLSSRNTKSAKKIFQEILSIHPEDPQALEGIGDAEMLNGSRWTASEYYRKAAILNPEDDTVFKKVLFLEEGDPSGFFGKYSITENETASIYSKPVISQINPYEILYDEGLHKVISQNSIISRFRIIIKITNESGVEKLRSFPLSGTLVSSKIIRNGLKTPDDFTVNDREVVFNSLQTGDIIDLQYTLIERTVSRFQSFGSSWLFGEEGVINRNSVIAFYLPDGITGSFSIRGKVKESSFSYNNGTVHIFRTENVFIPEFEKFMPYDRSDFIPRLEYSFVKSWSDIAQWQIKFIQQGSIADAGIVAIADRISSSNLSKSSAVELLRDFVASKITYSFNDTGLYTLKPEHSDTVLKRMSGDCKDKALLLKVILNASGIKADYALVRSKDLGSLNKEVPSMQFDHALVYIREQDGIDSGFFVDPSTEYDISPGISSLHEDVEALVLEDESGNFSFKTVHSDATPFSEIVINPAGISIARFGGAQASMLRYSKKSGGIENVLSESIRQLTGQFPEIKNIRSADPAESNELTIEFNSGVIIPKPVNSLFKEIVNSENRTYPLDLSTLPANIKLSVLSGIEGNIGDFAIDSQFIRYSCEKHGKGGLLITFKIKKTLVSPEEFAELKKTVISIIEFEDKLPVK